MLIVWCHLFGQLSIAVWGLHDDFRINDGLGDGLANDISKLDCILIIIQNEENDNKP